MQLNTIAAAWLLVLQLLEDVREECLKFGTLEGLCAPRPPISISDSEGSRVFVKFSTHEEAKAAKNAFNGREFDGNAITAMLASEDDYNKAMQGEWTGQYAQQPMSVAIDAGAPGYTTLVAVCPEAGLPYTTWLPLIACEHF